MACENDMKCFTLTWKIENFSKFFSPGLPFRSQVWKTESTEGRAWWQVEVRHSGPELLFFLTNLDEKYKVNQSQFEVSFLTSYGGFPMTNETAVHPFSYCVAVQKRRTKIIIGITKDSAVPEDTLTFCCKMRHQSIRSGQCLLRTVLHKVNFTWSIEELSFQPHFQKRTLHQQETLLFSSIMYKTRDSGTHKVDVRFIPHPGIWSTFISCKMTIKDNRGRVVSDVRDITSITWSWVLEIFSESNDSLHLEIESSVAVDLEYPQLTTHSKSVLGSSKILIDDLLLLLKEGLHSDATLNTDGKSFSAHRGILAARSPVFRAMFEKDEMNEARSGVVDIDDVDSETMDRMLVFLYGGLLDDVQWEEASALYYAADKYAVLPLKQKCVDILMAGLSVDNACDILVLADAHSDQELKKCVVDFICLHQEVISSPKWDALEEKNSRLTSKICRELLLKCKRRK